MFLSVMILFQNSLPCTENFYCYIKNFEKYDLAKDGAKVRVDQTPVSIGNITSIPSPTRMSISPLVSLSKDLGINFNPNSQKNMLQLAAN